MDETLKFSKLRSTAFGPTRGSEKSAGLDLAAAERIIVSSKDSQLVSTGLKVNLYLY